MSNAALQPRQPGSPSFMARVSGSLLRVYIAVPVVGFSLALLGWSLLFRLPNAPVVVQARAPQAVPIKPNNADFESAVRRRVRDTNEIRSAVATLEQSARALGFKVEVTMKPALRNAAGFKELAIDPAVVRLEEDYTQDRAAFARALEWLRQASAFPGKVELNSLQLNSDGDGLAGAQVELHFWRAAELDEPAAK